MISIEEADKILKEHIHTGINIKDSMDVYGLSMRMERLHSAGYRLTTLLQKGEITSIEFDTLVSTINLVRSIYIGRLIELNPNGVEYTKTSSNNEPSSSQESSALFQELIDSKLN